jgi:hypothetical protein
MLEKEWKRNKNKKRWREARGPFEIFLAYCLTKITCMEVWPWRGPFTVMLRKDKLSEDVFIGDQ